MLRLLNLWDLWICVSDFRVTLQWFVRNVKFDRYSISGKDPFLSEFNIIWVYTCIIRKSACIDTDWYKTRNSPEYFTYLILLKKKFIIVSVFSKLNIENSFNKLQVIHKNFPDQILLELFFNLGHKGMDAEGI